MKYRRTAERSRPNSFYRAYKDTNWISAGKAATIRRTVWFGSRTDRMLSMPTKVWRWNGARRRLPLYFFRIRRGRFVQTGSRTGRKFRTTERSLVSRDGGCFGGPRIVVFFGISGFTFETSGVVFAWTVSNRGSGAEKKSLELWSRVYGLGISQKLERRFWSWSMLKLQHRRWLKLIIYEIRHLDSIDAETRLKKVSSSKDFPEFFLIIQFLKPNNPKRLNLVLSSILLTELEN